MPCSISGLAYNLLMIMRTVITILALLFILLILTGEIVGEFSAHYLFILIARIYGLIYSYFSSSQALKERWVISDSCQSFFCQEFCLCFFRLRFGRYFLCIRKWPFFIPCQVVLPVSGVLCLSLPTWIG